MMDVLAGFFDPNADGFDILDMAQIVGLIVAIVGLAAMYWRYHSKQVATIRAGERQEIKHEIIDALDERTQGIQPGYKNGGDSLHDISMLGRLMLDGQQEVLREVAAIRARLDEHIDNHHRERLIR